MTRVKSGINTKKKHNRILKLAKGYRMSRRKQIKKAHEAVLHAGQYAYVGRKNRKRDFRRLWITRLNTALKEIGLKYNLFIHQLDKNKIELDRKILAQLAVEHPKIFRKIVDEIK